MKKRVLSLFFTMSLCLSLNANSHVKNNSNSISEETSRSKCYEAAVAAHDIATYIYGMDEKKAWKIFEKQLDRCDALEDFTSHDN